jgi:hypothetical protein
MKLKQEPAVTGYQCPDFLNRNIWQETGENTGQCWEVSALQIRREFWNVCVCLLDRLCGPVQTTNTDVPGSIAGHSLGFFWGSWVWNGVHSASWSDKLSTYLNKEVTVRFEKLKMQLWDSMCWPHVNPVPSGAVGKDRQRRLLSRPRFVKTVAPRIIIIIRQNTESKYAILPDQSISCLHNLFLCHSF